MSLKDLDWLGLVEAPSEKGKGRHIKDPVTACSKVANGGRDTARAGVANDMDWMSFVDDEPLAKKEKGRFVQAPTTGLLQRSEPGPGHGEGEGGKSRKAITSPRNL